MTKTELEASFRQTLAVPALIIVHDGVGRTHPGVDLVLVLDHALGFGRLHARHLAAGMKPLVGQLQLSGARRLWIRELVGQGWPLILTVLQAAG